MPILALLLAVAFWGWSFAATKLLLEHLTPLQLIASRFVLGWPLLLGMTLARRRRAAFSAKEWGVIGLAGMVLSAHFLIQVGGLQYTSATNTGWLIALSPPAIALLSFFFLGERLTLKQAAGILTATSGVLLLVSGGQPASLGWMQNRGDWLELSSAFTWAFFTVVTRSLARERSPLAVTTWALAATTVLSAGALLWTGQWSTLGPSLAGLPAQGWAALIFLAGACLALCFWLWQYGVARLGASRAGYFLYLEPFAATVLAVPLLGESFGWPSALGGILILSGVFITERRRHQEEAA